MDPPKAYPPRFRKLPQTDLRLMDRGYSDRVRQRQEADVDSKHGNRFETKRERKCTCGIHVGKIGEMAA